MSLFGPNSSMFQSNGLYVVIEMIGENVLGPEGVKVIGIYDSQYDAYQASSLKENRFVKGPIYYSGNPMPNMRELIPKTIFNPFYTDF
jgi:hypothetical protein